MPGRSVFGGLEVPSSGLVAGAPAGDGLRLYVGNLSYEVQWQDLKDHFKQAGNIVRAEVPLGEDGRSRGYGLVEFALPEEAQRAIATLNDTELKGRSIFVREDREAPAPAVTEPVAGRRLYVGNLSYDVNWYDLKDHFKQCGNVVRADIMEEPRGRSKGCGLVEFSLAEEAQRAIATLNDTELKGRTIFVREDREASTASVSGPVAGRRLYVGNLSYDVAWYDLKDHFKQCGNVVRADVLEEAGGRSKGCGLVEFALAEEAQLAITTLNDTELKGRTIFVREDREVASAGPRIGGGGGGISSSSNSHGLGGSGHASNSGSSNGASGAGIGTRVFVGNLSWDLTWPQLKDHFKAAGNVAHADIPVGDDGRSRGYGIVEFKNSKDAVFAIRTLNGSLLGGRPIKLREYGEGPKE